MTRDELKQLALNNKQQGKNYVVIPTDSLIALTETLEELENIENEVNYDL